MASSKVLPLKPIVSFIILFLLYHLAEYMIVFKNNIPGFFIFQLLFFLSAWLLGNWNMNNGLSFWSLPFSKFKMKYFFIGFCLGIILYGIPFILSIALKLENIIKIPDLNMVLKASLPFAFGVLFSSFSEDILTRGAVFSFFKDRVKPLWFIGISALIYLLNHIYRLQDGPDTLTYIFLLGVLFCIPLVISKNLWITGFMHWSGNLFFFISHNVIEVESTESILSPNTIFSLWILILIPVLYFLGINFKHKLQ